MKTKLISTFAAILLAAPGLFAQNNTYSVLLSEMQKFERNVVETYRNYLWLYYEEKQSANELLVFEDLLGIYVKRQLEAYETMALLGQNDLVEPRDIAARAFIFRALTFLEKAPIDVTYFEKACYDYYEALKLYEGTDQVPVIFKELPLSIRLGNRSYRRLIDLLDEKGKDLFEFGQVYIVLRNFKVTSPFDEDALELVRLSVQDSSLYTYQLAQDRLKDGFRAALRSNRTESVYLALPAGIYYIRSKKDAARGYQKLATLYVRPNQFISYVVEPISDWVIFYETPGAHVPGSGPHVRQALAATDFNDANELRAAAAADAGSGYSLPVEAAQPPAFATRSVEVIDDMIQREINNLAPAELEQLPIARTKKEFSRNMAQIISARMSGEYLSSWNRWTLAWNIAKAVTDSFAANSTVTTPTIRLSYAVIRSL